jgi:hypothetical protein
MMMLQAQKYLWINCRQLLGLHIFARWCAMFSENDHSCSVAFAGPPTDHGSIIYAAM